MPKLVTKFNVEVIIEDVTIPFTEQSFEEFLSSEEGKNKINELKKNLEESIRDGDDCVVKIRNFKMNFKE
jgi:hypothetical protein